MPTSIHRHGSVADCRWSRSNCVYQYVLLAWSFTINNKSLVCDYQGGEAAVEKVRSKEDQIVLCDALDEYKHGFILK